ncbi:MAG: T9SS type A sorting domain-containing protein [Candidatus Cloacimonetes bacterium]|nr:T9SS type A sorting domain-containing protein [Candidatus Cloacimonadota bacterium]
MKVLIISMILISALVLSAANSPAFQAFQEDITRQSADFKNSALHQEMRNSRETRDYEVGDTHTFWRWYLAVMPPTWIQTPATCRAAGDHAYIFVADNQWNSYMDQADADTVLAHFEEHTIAFPDQGIYDLDTQYFGPIPDELDNDPKMIIFYSALGSFQGTSFDGYFSAYNQVTEAEAQQMNPPGHSNECEMIYMTCNPLNPVAPIRLSVLAHETEHLIHWGTDVNEDTWVDEGCAEYAMYLYGYPDPIVDFPNQPDNNLIVWDQEFSDYVQTYLFTVFLSENYGGHDIISEIVSEPANSISGVENALISLGYMQPFESVFADWTNANYLGDYDTIDLPAFQCVSTYNSFPVSGNATVNGWAADYYKFVTGGIDLAISFNANTGPFTVNILKINNSGYFEIEPVVIQGTSGTITLPDFEPEFDYIVMNVSNLSSSSKSYSFSLTESTMEELNFWTYNFNNSTYTQITATRQNSGTYCNVFVDNAIWENTVSQNDVDLVARVFDDSTAADPAHGIYELDTQMFGMPSDIDDNGKVNILLYDIDDADINGFFSPSDISGGTHSNNMEIIYIDENPHGSGINSSYCFSTVAHEFQHLIHYTLDPNEQTWINEGLSCFAQTVTGWVSPYWMVMFTQNPDNNITQWTAGPDYPQTWLFMIYLWEHYSLDDENIIYNLVAEPLNGMDGIDAALQTTGWLDFYAEDVFNNWVIANFINDQEFMDGLFGYADNPVGTGTYAMGTVNDISFYPTSETYSMQHWSVNYFTFTNLENSLKINFLGNADYSQFKVRLVSFTGNTPFMLYEMNLDEFATGEITLPNNDENYDNVVMFVTDTSGGTGTVEYSYIAEDVISQTPSSPDEIALITNVVCYPNPFNPETTIAYSLATEEHVILNVYNSKGQLVKNLIDERQKAGENAANWNGIDNHGQPVSSGLYFYRLITPAGSISDKLILLK